MGTHDATISVCRVAKIKNAIERTVSKCQRGLEVQGESWKVLLCHSDPPISEFLGVDWFAKRFFIQSQPHRLAKILFNQT